MSVLIKYILRKEGVKMENNYYIGQYNELIEQYPILSPSEEKELFLSLKETGSKEARKKIINSNIRLVIKISFNYINQCNNSFTIDDLIEYGITGLIKAVDKFDVTKNCKFSTYATNWIKHEILYSIDLRYCDIYKPYQFFTDRKLYNKIIKDFYDLNGRKPNYQEISSLSGLSLRRIKFIESNFDAPISLDAPLFSESEYCVSDYISDYSFSIDEYCDNMELRSIFINILDSMRLSDRNREMFILRYGLDGNGKRSLEFLSKKYGITCQGVQQAMYKVLDKIRTRYRDSFGGYIVR